MEMILLTSLLLLSCFCWQSSFSETRGVGVPLLLASIFTCEKLSLLPVRCFRYEDTFPVCILRSAFLIVCIDFFQFVSHSLIHKRVFGETVHASHMRHHSYKKPTPDEAFETGVADSVLQLLIPLLFSVMIVTPDHASCILAGVVYENWLFFLHSGKAIHLPRWIVTPSKHSEHHRRPMSNLSHLIDWMEVWKDLKRASLRFQRESRLATLLKMSPIPFLYPFSARRSHVKSETRFDREEEDSDAIPITKKSSPT